MGGFANNAPIVTDGLVFYVDAGNGNSYPNSGTTWSDLIGGNDGTLANGPTLDSGNGGSLVFDGTNQYALIGDGLISGLSQFTIDTWVKVDQTNSPMNIIYHEWFASDNAVLFRIQSNVIQFYIRKSDDSGNIGGSFNSFTDTTNWNHLVGTWDGTTLKVYVNKSAMATTYTGSGAVRVTTTQNSYIGYYGNPPIYYFDGKMSSLKIYNRALSASEITQNYNALKNRFV